MYETIIMDIISRKDYPLSELVARIDTLWLEGRLTDEQRTALTKAAQESASMSGEVPGWQDALARVRRALADEIAALAARVETLEQKAGVEPPVPEEYPDWTPWDGIPPVPWQMGSKCTHSGSRWVSGVADNVWEPGGAGVPESVWRREVV